MALLNNTDKLRVLVTGNNGFIGSSLIKKLGNKIHFETTDQGNNRKVNILKRNQLQTVGLVDAIIHLASKTSIPDSNTNPYDTYYTNILGTLNVLDYARQNNISKIINTSTFVYGIPQYLPIDEKHPINPHSPYTKSKLMAERLCEYYSKDYGIDIVTLRPFYVYGPAMKMTTFIPSIIKQIREGNRVFLSSRNTRRDFLYIDDLVDIIDRILLDFPKGHNVYNVGFGKSYSLEKVIEIIEKILKIDIDIEYDDSLRPNDIVNMEADNSSLRNLYNWCPKIDIEVGLRLTLDDDFNSN
jgi:UDP-glucose 4-epimerase